MFIPLCVIFSFLMSDVCLLNLEKIYTNKNMGLMGPNSFSGYTGAQLWSAGFNNDIWSKSNKVCKHWKKCIFLLCSKLAEHRLYYLNIKTCKLSFKNNLHHIPDSYTSSCLCHIKYHHTLFICPKWRWNKRENQPTDWTHTRDGFCTFCSEIEGRLLEDTWISHFTWGQNTSILPHPCVFCYWETLEISRYYS